MGQLSLFSGGHRRALVRLTGVLAAATLVAAPSAAAGGDPNPHDGVSSVSQYIEDIPTSDGPIAAGGGTGGSPPPPPAPLQADVGEALERSGGRDAPVLKEIATKPELGAPTRALPRENESLSEVLDDPSAAAAAASATTGGGSAVAVAILLIALVTLGSAALAVRRARS